MRVPLYSLRTGILAQLIFLIIAAMLLINVVMVKIAEKGLVGSKLRRGELLIRAVEMYLGEEILAKKRSTQGIASSPRFRSYVASLLETGGFSDAVIIDSGGTAIYRSGDSRDFRDQGQLLARDAMERGLKSTDFYGMVWGVIWLNNREMRISSPLSYQGKPIGGVSLNGSLIPIYEALRRSQKILLLYIVIDTIVLALVGIYLLSRLVVKPIHRLLKITAEYKEGEFLPSLSEASRDEIGELSKSLNNMLKRLDENKQELKAHIFSLEKANRELKQAQSEIIKSEKLASVGRLAAGIAHEIGNPIGIILGYLELINRGQVTEEEKEDFFKRMETEISRVNQIIKKLLDFSRLSSGMMRETSVHDVIHQTIDILAPQPMMDDINIQEELKATQDIVWCDPNELQQVFLNIVMNAVDTLEVKRLSAGDDPEKTLLLRSANRDDAIEVRVEDNGCGIPEQDLSHIFDPFYTTKEPGKGTGLGLAVCYRIVEGIGGRIMAESTLGKGTAIIITLPLKDGGGNQTRP
ncbi:MAG: HAMP domain-containing protein [Deltaproteobacteria bacterium]|nr:HAMP domain-containing protein [Deltaproteobacteria bacterium]MBW2137509.1 HAMP domain-containing protein [Deltaproteobacteria bacterium]